VPETATSAATSTAASAAPAEWSASTIADFLIAAAILGLFVLACINSASRPDVTTGFDEPAHISYAAHIQQTGDAWPALEKMRLLDPRTFRFTDNANYLNHPPIFYALLASIGPTLVGHPQAIVAYRLFDVAIVTLGFAALLALALSAQFSRLEFYAYAVPLAFIPILVQLAASVSNDDLAFFGGALATLGVWQMLAAGRGFWLAFALFGMIAAAFAKLTGFLLTGGMVAAALGYLLWRGRLRWRWTIAAGLAFAVAAAPYVIYLIHYGSPTPDTPAQIVLLEAGAHAAGWDALPRKSFPDYLAGFIADFVADWMPVLGARSAFNYAMLFVPATALAAAAAGAVCSLRRLWRWQETPLDVVVIAGTAALAATFAVHVTFSYGRHLATGWLLDAYPRYYLPLAAIVPLAGLSLAAAIESPRWRVALLAFLIAGPIAFRIFGAPIG